MGQGPQALELLPQAVQRLPAGGEGQVLSHPLGHHAVALVLALEDGAEGAVSDELSMRRHAGRPRRRRGREDAGWEGRAAG